MFKSDTKEYKFFGLPIFLYIFFLAAFLRLYNLGAVSIRDDEAFSIWVAKLNLPMLVKYISTDAHPPLYFILLHGWIKLFGDGEFAARLLSVIFSLGTLILIYVLCNEIFKDKKYGLSASFLFAASSFSIITIDTDVRMYGLLMFLTTLSAYLLCVLMNNNSAEPSFKKAYLWFLYTIVLVLLCYTQYVSFFVIFAELLYLCLFMRGGVKKSLYIIFILLLVFLPWVKVFSNQLFVFHKCENNFGAHLFKESCFYPAYVFYCFFMWFSTEISVLKVCILGLVLFVFAALGSVKSFNYKNGGIIPATFFAVFILSYAMTCLSLRRFVFNPRYLSLIFPLFIILLSRGSFEIKNNILRRVFIVLLAIFFGCINLANYYNYITNSKYWKQDWKIVAKYVGDHEKKADAILLQPSSNYFGFNYYYKDKLYKIIPREYEADKREWVYETVSYQKYLSRGGLPQFKIDSLDINFLNSLADKHARLIYIFYAGDLVDPERKVLKYLAKKYVFSGGVEAESLTNVAGSIYVSIFEKRK